MSNIGHIPKELSYIYSDDLYDEVKRLERQLAEAREGENRLKELGLEAFKLGFELGLNNETYELHRSLEEKEEELRKLKEQG